MSTDCRSCGAASEVYLCVSCVDLLAELLDQMPWLLSELAVTTSRQDRLRLGAVGKGNDNPSGINFGAMELGRQVEDLFGEWIGKLCDAEGVQFLPALCMPTGFIGPLKPGWRRLPRGYEATATQMSKWLRHHLRLIARQEKAGEFAKEVVVLVGDPDKPNTHPGRLIRAINRHDRVFAGPCPGPRGYNQQGEVVECGTILYADAGLEQVECPRCKHVVDVAKNRLKASVDRDLLPEKRLLEVMETLGEPVTRSRVLGWISDERLHVRGYIHQGSIVAKQVRRGDARVFSLNQARHLRWCEDQDNKRKEPA